MITHRRALLFAMLASPLAVVAAQAAPDSGQNSPAIPDDVSGNSTRRRRRRHDENHDESHHGRERHRSRRRSRRHRDGDDD